MEAFRGSHHDRAMQEATEQTVLGDFNNAKFPYAGVTSRFFKRDGKFFVNTDGPDGKLRDYEIKYTFGVTPRLPVRKPSPRRTHPASKHPPLAPSGPFSQHNTFLARVSKGEIPIPRRYASALPSKGDPQDE